MKKAFSLFLCLGLGLSLFGCGSEEKPKVTNKSQKEVIKILEKNGYELKDRYDDFNECYEVYLKNDDSGNAFALNEVVQEEYGKALIFQYNSTEMILTTEKEKMNGEMEYDDVYKKFENELSNLKLSETNIYKLLEEKLNKLVKSNENKYDDGVFEVGKDISAGEYVLISNGGSYEIRSTAYDSNDKELYEFSQFIDGNEYLIVENGDFLSINKAKLYSVSEKPKLDVNSNGMFKVGLDIDSGIYNVKPKSKNSLYQIEEYHSDYKSFRSEASDYQFKDTKQIKLNDGEYVILLDVKIEKQK